MDTQQAKLLLYSGMLSCSLFSVVSIGWWSEVTNPNELWVWSKIGPCILNGSNLYKFLDGTHNSIAFLSYDDLSFFFIQFLKHCHCFTGELVMQSCRSIGKAASSVVREENLEKSFVEGRGSFFSENVNIWRLLILLNKSHVVLKWYGVSHLRVWGLALHFPGNPVIHTLSESGSLVSSCAMGRLIFSAFSPIGIKVTLHKQDF